ncbi:MAG: hypothetical protein U9P71_01865 [Campylobacterota bacterium]|nr:hypothetical protein [Campylobacterota bacterium]
MKKIALSALAALVVAPALLAGTTKLYTDTATGQVFTQPGENRIEMKKSDTPVYAKTSKLKFSGVHYLGFKASSPENGDTTTNFETRRNYFQVKAYLFDDPKSYLRTTLDTHQDETGDWKVRLKYAYLYLNEVLPNTGMEFGQVHRPWIDYEEHQGWWVRSISKVFVEASEASHLTNSADLGVNFKTKTDYFTSEVGLFNGEGYHAQETGAGNSLEWRATAAILGNGKKKRKPLKDDYFDASFFGQYNMDSSKNDEQTYAIYGLHTVYNMPSLLVSGQYVVSDNDNELSDTSQYNGSGFSLNGTYRFGDKKEYSIIGRYDNWTAEKTLSGEEYETNSYIYGAAWQQNKNVKWLLSGQTYDPADGKNYKGIDVEKRTDILVTAEVHW